MNDKGTTTPQANERAGHTNWERRLLGPNGIVGTMRMVVFVAVVALLFGSLFYFAG